MVSIRNGFLIGCNSADDIYYRVNWKADWVKLEGKLISVSIDEKGAIIGANRANDIYYKPSLSAPW